MSIIRFGSIINVVDHAVVILFSFIPPLLLLLHHHHLHRDAIVLMIITTINHFTIDTMDADSLFPFIT